MNIISSDASSVTIDLGESLTFNEHRLFRELMDEALQNNKGLVFRCSSLAYIDSAGLGMLLLAKHETEKYGKKAQLDGVKGQALELLKTVAFDKHFNLEG